MDSMTVFAFSFAFNLAVAVLIVRYIYYPAQRDKDYVLTFFTFNTSVFLVSYLLAGVDLNMGFGFGLFAIFSILRYRTDPLPIREMTYLFILMALPVVDAILVLQGWWSEMILANASILAVFYVIEKLWTLPYEVRKSVTYERIDLIRPENYALLLDDLRMRTGLAITRCEVGRIDFLHDVAEIKIFYAPHLPERAPGRAQAPAASRSQAERAPSRMKKNPSPPF